MIEGKIANQNIQFSINAQVRCGKCNKLIPRPKSKAITTQLDGKDHTFLTFHFIGTEYWIYETKSGTAVCYCSEYCRNKHNHRFSKKG